MPYEIDHYAWDETQPGPASPFHWQAASALTAQPFGGGGQGATDEQQWLPAAYFTAPFGDVAWW